MAKFSHKNANVDVGAEDISGDTNSCELTIDIGTAEVTCFEDDWDKFVENIASWGLSIAGFTNQDASEVEAVLFAFIGAGEQDLIYCPQGTATGYKFTGKVILTSQAVGGAVKGACPYSASFQGSGQLSRTACP